MQNEQMTMAQRLETAAQTLLDMEALTVEMIGSPEEALPAMMARRQEMIAQVDALRAACKDAVPADGEEAQRVFAAQQTACAAACRIRELDGQLLSRLKLAQARILEKLRSVGRSAGAKASRYYQPAMQSHVSVFKGKI